MATIGGRKSNVGSNAGAAAIFAVRRLLDLRSSSAPSVLIRSYETQTGFILPAGSAFTFNPANLDVREYSELFFHLFIDQAASLSIEWNNDLAGLGEEGWVKGDMVNANAQSEPDVGVVFHSLVQGPQCRFIITAGSEEDVTFIAVEVVGK